jgi:hypothetical protein
MNIVSAPMRVTRGEPVSWAATVTGQDWTGYTGTVTFRRNRVLRAFQPDYGIYTTESDPIVTATVTGNGAGVMSFSLTAAETDLFPSLPRIGWFSQAKAEIEMTDGSDVQKFQIRVSVADAWT